MSNRQDVLLGNATGKSRRGVSHLLERHDWLRVFATVKTADEAPSKPHPGMILQALDELDVAPYDAVMIGDSSYDMAMARAAGITAIGVAWGFQPVAALIEAGAHRIVHSYAELEPVLSGFLNQPSHPPG